MNFLFLDTCILDNKGGYYCKCSDGTIGKTCGDICDLNPCMHGKCTQVSNTSYNCECSTGFAGKNCEIGIFFFINSKLLAFSYFNENK